MNYLEKQNGDWGSWNRAYTRMLIRARGYHLVSMPDALPAVEKVEDLTKHENGAVFWLKPRKTFHDLPPPRVILGPRADEVAAFFQRNFAPHEDHPWIAYFANPILYGRQFSILDTQRHAFEECFIRDRRWRQAVPKRGEKLTPKRVPGTYLLTGVEFHQHFAHVFCDVLPRASLFEEAGLLHQIPALLPALSFPYANDAWHTLGLDGAESLRWDDTCWQLDGLYFASPFKTFCGWTQESARWIRSKFSPGLDQKPLGKKVYYISRRGESRPLVNEQEILQHLEPLEITIVQPDKFPLRQQIELFADAGMIIGPHGAGLQNALWAPHGCRVLEIVNPDYVNGMYWTLAESLNQPYGLVSGKTVPGQEAIRGEFTCDPNLVKEAVGRLRAMG